MSISLKTEHLKRYKDVAWLLMKYGRSDLVKQAGLEEAVESDAATVGQAPAEAEELASDLEKLGPTFIKLAQLLSTRADLLPRPYLESLSRLQDKVEPFSFGEVERIVSRELGVRLSKAFAEFVAEPMAAASLGQVHRATLRDGREVVVKVQRPNIRERVVEDLTALEELAGFLDRHTQAGERYDFATIVGELRKSVLRELDYRQEARNLAAFAANLRDFERLVVPRPVEDYTTTVVLTMDFIKGKKITELTPLAILELSGAELAEDLFHAYLKQMLLDGFFHADPHPGNVLLTEEGRVALVDLGMVARLTPQFQDDLLQLLVAISDGRGDEAAHISIRMGEPKESFEQVKFVRQVGDLVGQHQSGAVGQMNAGRIVLEITRISGEYGLRLPPEFTMIAKTLFNLVQVVQALDPEVDPTASIRRHD